MTARTSLWIAASLAADARRRADEDRRVDAATDPGTRTAFDGARRSGPRWLRVGRLLDHATLRSQRPEILG